MELKDLAPWIAIAFTLALSILVPLFTQIANNKFQLKQQELKYKHEKEEKRMEAYNEFLDKAGACITFAKTDNIGEAGSSIQKLMPYFSKEIGEALNELFNEIRGYHWDTASTMLKKIIDKTAENFGAN